MLSYVKHGSFPSLCIGDNLGTVLEYNNYILCDYIKRREHLFSKIHRHTVYNKTHDLVRYNSLVLRHKTLTCKVGLKYILKIENERLKYMHIKI